MGRRIYVPGLDPHPSPSASRSLKGRGDHRNLHPGCDDVGADLQVRPRADLKVGPYEGYKNVHYAKRARRPALFINETC